MNKLLMSAALAITIASGSAFAQAPATQAPASPPAANPAAAPTAPVVKAPTATPAPVATLDAATEAKFKAVDKNSNGVLDGAEVVSFKNDMTKIDADKDGKISKAEFAAAVKGGVIK